MEPVLGPLYETGIHMDQEVDLLKRQYLQLIEPDQLSIPALEGMRKPGLQARIFQSMFEEGSIAYPPPDRYKIRVLKKLIDCMEKAIIDPEEDEISNDLTACLSQLIVQPQVSASLAAQQKSYVSYTVPSCKLPAPFITLLESHYLLASSGTTGLRTWEAALDLGTFLYSQRGRQFIESQNVLELGAGTGFLSIMCAKILGAKYVLATDGNGEVIDDLASNIFLNDLEGGGITETAVLKWGHTLIDGILDDGDSHRTYDIILGADLTYDLTAIPPLVSTYRELFDRYPNVKALLSATERNEQTLRAFINTCTLNKFKVEAIPFKVPEQSKQLGFFHPPNIPIHIFLITRAGIGADPFALN